MNAATSISDDLAVESRLDKAQREGEELRDWSRWWRRRGADQLGLILWAAWDPIGSVVPRDEYDGQALTLAKELRRGRTVEEIAEWLANNSLLAGQDAPAIQPGEADREVAGKIVDWYASELERLGARS